MFTVHKMEINGFGSDVANGSLQGDGFGYDKLVNYRLNSGDGTGHGVRGLDGVGYGHGHGLGDGYGDSNAGDGDGDGSGDGDDFTPSDW